MDTSREILQFLHYNPQSSREEIANGIKFDGSDTTLKRIIASLVQSGDVVVNGKARATRYELSPEMIAALGSAARKRVQHVMNFPLRHICLCR